MFGSEPIHFPPADFRSHVDYYRAILNNAITTPKGRITAVIKEDVTPERVAAALHDSDPYAPLKEALEANAVGYQDDPDDAGWLHIVVNRTVQVKVLHPENAGSGWSIRQWVFHYRSDPGLPWAHAWLSAGTPLSDVVTMIRDIIAEVLGE